MQGALDAALQAVVIYPRAYAQEIMSRMSLGAAVMRGAARLGRGLPLLLMLAAYGVATRSRDGAARPALVWLVLSAIGILAQWQMAGYHLYLLVPPLVLLAALGAARAAELALRLLQGAARRQRGALASLTALALVLALPAAAELRLVLRQYAPHRALRSGRITSDEFLAALGGPGPNWLEAGMVAAEVHGALAVAPTGDNTLLVWGLAPAVYARCGLRPATRWVFHQTFLVEDAPLARRWPDARARRSELLQRLRLQPPRFVVIVSGDRSGLEPEDSRAELHRFPELETILATRYRPLGASSRYQLLQLVGGTD
jgi:hypothetical protein